jgi:peptide/nickel transport system permease protein
MTSYILRRLIQGIFVIILATIVIFIAMRILPGDPLMIYIVEQDISFITPELKAKLRHKYGLDKNLVMQYFNWIGGLLRGDMGLSIHYQESVSALMAKRVPITLLLGLLSFIISSILGMLTGVLSALRRASLLDNALTSFANFGISVPPFWLGILMIYLLAVNLGWLPAQGYVSPFDDLWESVKHLIMPVFVLSIWGMAFISRQARSSMLEVLRQDYVRTAWAKGLRERVVVLRHVLKNGLIPVVAVIGMRLSFLIGGMVVLENVFNIPGVGRLLVDSVLSQDYQVVQAGILIIAISVVFVNLIIDVCYGWIDPRIKYR